MPVDFKVTGADDGYNDDESIQPYDNGEAAEQTVFRRPPENLRTRTEAVRKALDDFFLTNAADRGLLLAAADNVQVTWNGTVGEGGDGKWAINTGTLELVPIISSDIYTAKDDIAARLSYRIAADTFFTVRSYHESGAEIRAYNGANNLRFRIFKVDGVTFPGHTPVITVEGSNDGGTYDPALGPVLVSVQVSHDTQIRSTWGQVVTEINADAVAGTFLRSFVEAGETGTYADEITEQFLWEGSGAVVSGIGAVDAQTFRITQAELATFFSTGGGAAGMADGDSVVIEFETARDRLDTAGNATIGSALRLLHRNESDLGDDPDAFSSVGNSFQGNAIPLCKVIKNDLYFVNGTVFDKDETGYLRSNDARLRAQLAAQSVPVGAALVGNDGTAGTNYTLSAGTLDAQVDDVLGFVDGLKTEYDDHVDGSADQHPIKDIVDHPFVVVGPGGDYTDLETALETLAAGTGGTIFVHAGIYDMNATLATMNDTVRIIGEVGGSLGNYTEGVVIRPDTATEPAIELTDTSPQGKLIFEHIKFHGNNTSNVNVLKLPYANTHFAVEFRDCMFYKKFSSSTYPLVACGCDTLFEDCRMTGETSGESVPFFSGHAPTGYGPGLRFIFNRCHFSMWGQLVRLGGTGDADIGYFEFTNNFMYAVGYTSGVSDPGLLISTESSYRAHVNISNNYWPEDGGAPGGQDGRFCEIEGSGLIANNRLMHGVRFATVDAGYYAVAVQGVRTGISTTIVVRDNQIASVYAGCIELRANAVAAHNRCDCQPANGPTHAIVVGDHCICEGNTINYRSTISSGNNPAIQTIDVSGASRMRIIGNTVNVGNSTYHDGIGVGDGSTYSTDVVVSGNEIRGTSHKNSVHVRNGSTARVTISGNSLDGGEQGILAVGAGQIIANNNNISLSPITGLGGVYFSSVDEGAIVGNVIRGRNSGDTGIYCSGDDVVIAGNAVLNCATKFTVGGDSGIGTTGARDTTHNLY